MKKENALIWVIVAVVALAVLSDFLSSDDRCMVCFGGKCFDARLAVTQAEREKGLMYVRGMPAEEGMLFVFDKEDIYPFWMKNMQFPLDILWVDGNGTVVYVGRDAAPCKEELSCKDIVPDKEASYVLEVNAGQAENISVGDKMTIDTSDGST